MTDDEQAAKEYADGTIDKTPSGRIGDEDIEQAFLCGIAHGRANPGWVKIEPGCEMPKNGEEVLMKGLFGGYYLGWYHNETNQWRNIFGILLDPQAWLRIVGPEGE